MKKYSGSGSKDFTAAQWNAFSKKEQEDILMKRRLAFSAYGEVNWCETLGTVLANDEVVNGVSERGGYPVVKKKLRQWYLRITAYADRLLEGLDTVEFSDAMKEMQSNWIGKSSGAEVDFAIKGSDKKLRVYTTRPDTIFGVDFMVVAPELGLVNEIRSAAQSAAIDDYIAYVKSRSERERIAEKKITGCFTGAYAINPFNGREIPIWISEYVLAGYGTGAIMAVPCGDERDHKFAKQFGIPVTNIIGSYYNGEEANDTKDAILENSDFINGMVMKDAIDIVISTLEERGIGKRKVNYKMRDAAFSRQRYWGEPFPIFWKDGIAIPLDEKELPLELPRVDKYGPGPDGEGPLANLKEWTSTPSLLHGVEKGDAENVVKNEAKGAALVPKYNVNSPMQYELAKQMRKEYTDAEGHLWQQIRANKLDVKFRRQHPIESYIADFVCLQHALIVEVDGGYHELAEQKYYDEERTRVLNEIGFKIIRFDNDEVLNNTEAVIGKIKEALTPSLLHGVENEVSEDTLEGHNNKENVGGSEFSHPSTLVEQGKGVRETSTMPGYAGSSWYFLRYMDPHNDKTFCDRKISDYWNQVDLYIGGTEHAVGHLLYSRMWTKVMYDLSLIGFDEPYKKLLNQGMITGKSYFFGLEYLEKGGEFTIISYDKISDPNSISRFKYGHQFVDANGRLSKEKFEKSNSGITNKIIWEEDKDGKFLMLKEESEKMSKSKFNVDNPDDIVAKYGADTFRMYEMFLGPVEASKPWDTKGIEGVHRFLKKLWRLFFDELKGKIWNEESANEAELKVLHRTIKKIQEDTERFSFNTAVSTFMICVNDLADCKCNKKEVLEKLLVLLSPYAPHIAEELWHQLSKPGSILNAPFPAFDPKYLIETAKDYPVSINGKLRTNISLALDLGQKQVEEIVLQNEIVKKWLDGKEAKKIIFVKGKMVNIVI